MIKITKKDNETEFNNVYWLTQVTLKGDMRHHINTINIEYGLAYKTDSARIHSACVNFALNGQFEIIKRTKSEIILNEVEHVNWPNCDSIFEAIPDSLDEYLFSLYVSHKIIGGSVADFYLGFNEIRPKVNSHFVEECLNGFDCVHVWAKDEDTPVFFIDEDLNKIAAIMPMRKTTCR